MELNNIKTNGSWSVIAADLNQNFLKILTELLKYQHITTISGANFLGYFTSSSSLPTTDEAAWAIAGSLKSVTVYAYYTSDAIPNGFVEGWNALSSLGNYDFTDYSELLSGIENINKTISDMLQDIENLKSNPNIDIINNLTDGGTDKALSAEMGKKIGNALFSEGGIVEEAATQNDLKEDEYKQIDNNYRGYYAFEVGNDDFTLTLSVLSSSIKCAVHRTDNPSKWSSLTKDSGWVNSGETKSFDKTFGTGNYIRLIVTNVSGSGMPDFDTMKTSIQLEFNKTHYQEPGLAEKLDDLEEEMSDLHGVKDLVEKGESDMNINIISGKALNTVNGLHSSTLYELIDYIDVSELENVKIKAGFWNSDNAQYSTLIELYDESKNVIKRIIPSDLIGLTDIQWAYVFDGVIDVSGAYYIRFCNLVSVPASNKNPDFVLTKAYCKKTIIYKAEDVIDYELMKSQSEINKEINYVLYGNRASDSKVELTINELKVNYTSTTDGGGRGFFNIEITGYDKYNVVVKFKENPIVKAAVTIKRNTSYGSNVYDTGWFTSGFRNITETTATTSGGKYIGLVFTYTSGSGIPTVEEIAQSVDINFVGTILGDFGLQGKVEDLEKNANGTIVQETIILTKYDNPIGTSKYHGLKVDVEEHEFSWENIGQLGNGTSSRQGGALYGNYLFQFHDGLASVVVYNLETKTTVQVLTPSVSIRTHAGSGGFSKEFYDESDPFPILYISSMYEDVVQAYRITGIEGEFSMELVQTLILNIPARYVNITVDADNNRLVMFGYQKASWSDSADNMSVICSCSLPSVKDGDIAINKVDNLFYIPFIYAEQGAFARFGKLYLSFGNTISIAGMVVIDYVKKNVDTFVDFGVMGNWEPEAFCHYKGNILVTSQSGIIYKLSF